MSPAKKTAAAPAKKAAAKKTAKPRARKAKAEEPEQVESPVVEVTEGGSEPIQRMGEGHALHSETTASLNPAFYPQA